MAISPILVGYVDYKGHQITTPTRSGGWKSAILVLGLEIAEAFCYFGISANLINYLTGSLHLSTADAAEKVNLFTGVSYVLPILGAFVADSYLGRFKTILLSTVLGFAALVMISLSAGFPSLHPPDCKQEKYQHGSCASPSLLQSYFFFFPLYLLAMGHGFFKPSAQAFGADQFDMTNPQESNSRSSFFSWLYFGMNVGSVMGISFISYIEERVGWGIGFGIPCFFMVFGLLFFLFGRRGYRYGLKREVMPLSWLVKDMVVVVSKWFKPSSSSSSSSSSFSSSSSSSNTRKSKYGVDDAALLHNTNQTEADMVEDQCDSCVLPSKHMQGGEGGKAVLRLIPIWATCLICPLVQAQCMTFVIKQGNTMDRRIFSGEQIPTPTFLSLIGLALLITVPIYDRILVPVARRFTGIATGITMLQRIGIGLFVSLCSMVVAALVEIRRIRVARESGLIDLPNVMVPMSAWWLLPQTILIDLSGVFAMVGLQEFFYDQIPSELQSVGLSLYFTLLGIGSFLSSFLLFIVDKLSKKIEGASWLCDNLNRAHLDYLYLLLAGLSILDFGVFLNLARSYVYRSGSSRL